MPANDLFYSQGADLVAPAPLSPVAVSNFLDLNGPLQYVETMDYHSSETIPLALTPHAQSYHPLSPANENTAISVTPILQIKSVYNVLASCLEQEPVNSKTGFVLLSGHSYHNSIDSTLSGVSDQLHTVAISGHSLAHAASSHIAGQSNALTSETGSPTLQQEHSAVLAFPTVESAVVHRRKGTLRDRLQRTHVASRERVACPEPGCRKTFGFFSELRRHCVEVHGKDVRYHPKRWFACRGH